MARATETVSNLASAAPRSSGRSGHSGFFRGRFGGSCLLLGQSALQCGNPLFELINAAVASIRCSAKGRGLVRRTKPAGESVNSGKTVSRAGGEQACQRGGRFRGGQAGGPMFYPQIQIL